MHSRSGFQLKTKAFLKPRLPRRVASCSAAALGNPQNPGGVSQAKAAPEEKSRAGRRAPSALTVQCLPNDPECEAVSAAEGVANIPSDLSRQTLKAEGEGGEFSGGVAGSSHSVQIVRKRRHDEWLLRFVAELVTTKRRTRS